MASEQTIENRNPNPVNSPAPSPSPQSVNSTESNPHQSSTAVQIVWQWLTYALWAWALCALSILLSGVLTYFIIDKTGEYEFLIYTLATLLVLLPLAFIADRVYRKIEPPQKHGFAAVVMVLNAVIIFLIALGGIITAVIALFTLFINPGDSSGKVIAVMSASVVATLGILLFLRIMRPPKLRNFPKLFPYIVVIIAGLTVVLGMFGPFRAQVASRDDRLIEAGLPGVNDGIQNYARKNKQLPNNLSEIQVTYNDDAKQLISQNVIEYRVIAQPKAGSGVSITENDKTESLTRNRIFSSTPGKYELCVTYKQAKNSADNYQSTDSNSYISTYSHEAGRQCYTQTTNEYDY